jgi:hypothetical protein
MMGKGCTTRSNTARGGGGHFRDGKDRRVPSISLMFRLPDMLEGLHGIFKCLAAVGPLAGLAREL